MQKFSLGIAFRVLPIALFALSAAYCWYGKYYIFSYVFLFAVVLAALQLHFYATSINKKLSRIFDSIQFQDFAITFRADNKKGDSFEQLNSSLNAVVKSFNQIRAEREASLHFIQAIVQHINVGILSYNHDGKIEIVNQAANKILSIYNLSHISSIKNKLPEVHDVLLNLVSGDSKLIKINNEEISISVKEIVLRDRKIKLVAFHNIRSELQIRELEAWQNLTKVLRHEIMNSVTPIVSLTETMQSIINVDLSHIETPKHLEAINDLKTAVQTITNRSKGIMHFVNAYREFTSIPLPMLADVKVSELFGDVSNLYDNQNLKVLHFDVVNDYALMCDRDQIQQVMINLIKNALEAVENKINAKVTIKAFIKDQHKYIAIIDNGDGISLDKSSKIFVPFYTTKSNGSGIGLSLSRQIMLLHNGTLEYEQNEGGGSRFVMRW